VNFTGEMLQLDYHMDSGGILDDTLNRHLDELVETETVKCPRALAQHTGG
jgi:hypothetical protein